MHHALKAYQELSQLTRSITRVVELTNLLQEITESVARFFEVERAFLVLLESDETKTLKERIYIANSIFKNREQASNSFEPSYKVLLEVMHSGKGQQWLESRTDLPQDPSLSMEKLGLNTIFCEPLMVDSKILGALYLDSTLSHEPPAHYDELLATFAAQAAICIDKAQMIQERRQTLAKKHEDQIKFSELEGFNKALLSFLAICSHDLKNPIFAIDNNVQLLDRMLPHSPEDAKELLPAIQQSLQQSRDLINNYLDGARIYQDKLPPLLCEELQLKKFVETRLKEQPTLKQQEPVFTIKNLIPSDLSIVADRAKMSQILNNILSNAIKYSPQGGTITISAERHNNEVILEISDQGIGIEEGKLNNLFVPFQRFVQQNEFQGSGLGLWITHQLVTSHQGEITLTSSTQPPRGTKVTIRLPQEG